MRHNTKVKLLILLALLLLLILVVLAAQAFMPEDAAAKEPSVTEASEHSQAMEEPLASTAPELTEPLEETSVDQTEPVQVPTEKPSDDQKEPTQAPTEKPTTNQPQPVQPPSSPQQTYVPKVLSFPYAIPGTNLEIQKIESYDGIFLEDGSDRAVSRISAMILVNKSAVPVEYANIVLVQGDRELTFTATDVPAGTTVVVQEAGAAAYSSASYSECRADVAELEQFEMSSDLVSVEENEDGSLNVTNLTDQTIPCVRVFYKFALEKGAIYVGGITYTAKITDLKPGDPQNVWPSHYAAGSSEVMMVRTYDTAE